MDRWQWLKDEIKKIAPTIGIDQIGFTTAEPFDVLFKRLSNQKEKGFDSGFEEPDIGKRIDPKKHLLEAQSIIAIAIAYPDKMHAPPRSEEGQRRGIFARSAWGEDYHLVLKKRLKILEDFIHKYEPNAKMMSMVDTGALVDRAVAERAGIGFSAKNCSIISPKFGSWIYLGEMITTIPFPPDAPVLEGCGECTKCLDACPTQAFVGPGQLDAKKCLSYQTQSKGVLQEKFMEKLGNRLYGCDTCQVVCPKNKEIERMYQDEVKPDPEIVKPLLEPLLELSNRQFKQVFGHSAAAWRGKNPLQRNAVIALGHFKENKAIPILRRILLQDPRIDIRTTVVWSLKRIGSIRTVKLLHEAYGHEKNDELKKYIRKTLKSLQSKPIVVQFSSVSTPIGLFTIYETSEGICGFQKGNIDNTCTFIERRMHYWWKEVVFEKVSQIPDSVAQFIKAYFLKENYAFDGRIDLHGTPFQKKVWELIRHIPYGETMTYSEAAAALGNRKLAQAVSLAAKANPISLLIPCHRLVKKNQPIMQGLEQKQILRKLEQVRGG